MQNVKYFFVFILFVFSQFASASCFQSSWGESRMNATMVTQYLDCIARYPQLTRLSAQWILVKKSLWQLQDSNSSSFTYRYANNVMSPYERNTLFMKFSDYSWRNFPSLLTKLETDVFPKVLNGFDAKSEDNKTSWSFEAVAYQTIAFVEDPVRSQWSFQEGLNPGGRSYFYGGTLAASKDFRGSWYENHAAKHPVMLNYPQGNILPLQLFDREQNWPQLRALYQQLGSCAGEGDCLIRQERNIAQGLFLTLEHPTLVQAVHFQHHPGFGIQGTYKGSQEKLTTTYGCAVKRTDNVLPAEVVITGYLTYDHSMKNLAQFGRWGYLGRSIYIAAMNRQDIQSRSLIPGQFQGQNAIIRDISDSAIYDLSQMGGLNNGDPKVVWSKIPVTFSDGRTHELNWGLTENVYNVIGRLGGASRYFAEFANNPSGVNSRPFFTQTSISFGLSLAGWANMLKNLNPPVHYFIFGTDYGLRSAPSNNGGWKSYYDRVVWVSQNLFPNVNGVP